jgi:hypothetical protein
VRYIPILFLSACAAQPSYQWIGGNPNTFDTDFAHCEQQTLSAPIGRYETERGARIMLACMRTRGWSLTAR